MWKKRKKMGTVPEILGTVPDGVPKAQKEPFLENVCSLLDVQFFCHIPPNLEIYNFFGANLKINILQ